MSGIQETLAKEIIKELERTLAAKLLFIANSSFDVPLGYC